MTGRTKKVVSTALLLAASAVILIGAAGEDGSCSAASGESACQAPVATEKADEASGTTLGLGGLFDGFSLGSLTGFFGLGGERFPEMKVACKSGLYTFARQVLEH